MFDPERRCTFAEAVEELGALALSAKAAGLPPGPADRYEVVVVPLMEEDRASLPAAESLPAEGASAAVQGRPQESAASRLRR